MTFLPDYQVIAAFTLASFVLVVTPGPDMALFLGKTLTQGRKAGLVAMFGAASGIVVHTLLAAFGLSALLASSVAAFGILKIVGALYLLWLAYEAIAHGSSLSLEASDNGHDAIRQVFVKGIGINLLNPKIILFFVTFLPQFVSTADPNAASKLLFLGLYFICLAVPLCALMIAMADRLAMILKRKPRIMRILDWLFAGVFAAFAVRLLLEPSRN